MAGDRRRVGDARLIAHGLSIGYPPSADASPTRPLARHLELRLEAGRFVCLLGPNGAGKSTLLRTLVGMQPPLSGSIELDGAPLSELPPRRLARRLGVVLTDGVTPGVLRGVEMVRLGRLPHTPWTGRLRARDHEAVARALRRAGGEALAHRPLAEMSDGERQRMAIARALAQEPGVLVLDEPTAFLDLPSRLEFLDLLRRLAHNEGLAVLVTTHDLDAALACADRVWLLANGALRQGLPEELALDGSLARAFAAAGVAFDLERGSFRPRRALRASLHLDGDPLGVAWTRRALERLGLHATLGDRAAASDLPATGLQLRVERRPNDAEGTLCWWWSDGSASEEMISLAAVVERLEGRLEAPRR